MLADECDYSGPMHTGFIGLGRMGTAMVNNLLAAGHSVAAFNRSREKSAALETRGARVAESPADACSGADVVFTMVTDDAATEAVVFGPDGVAGALEPDAIHVAHSTISLDLARRLAEEYRKRSRGYLSAPVFGRPEAAQAVKLIVVPAGDARLIERCQPLFSAIGRRTFIAGAEPWMANLIKVCGNFTLISLIETFGEASAVLRKSGVAPQAFLDVMNELYGSPVVRNYGQMIVDQKYEPAGFALRTGLKDTRLMLQASEAAEAPMPLASLFRDVYLSALAHGQEHMDWASIAKVAARNAGVE
jgi:3-hydroxyisobutyrate dehydrogenase-like beta-hydroxyacid dehydrogenase